MIKTKCVCKPFFASKFTAISEFINEYLAKYDVVDVIQIQYPVAKITMINITIIYNEDVFDNNDKELLKEIIKLDHISINNVQSKLSIGFNRASNLINILENNKIISNKENGRCLLMSIEDALKVIDTL